MNELDYENRVLRTRQELLRSKLQHLRTLDQTIASQQQHSSTAVELTDPSKSLSDSISDLDIMLAELTLKPPMPPSPYTSRRKSHQFDPLISTKSSSSNEQPLNPFHFRLS